MMNKVSDLCPTCPIQPSRFQAVLLLFRWRSHFLSNPHDLKRCRKERSRVTETWGGQHIHCVSLLYPLCFCFCVSIHCVSVQPYRSASSGFIHAYKICFRDLTKVLRIYPRIQSLLQRFGKSPPDDSINRCACEYKRVTRIRTSCQNSMDYGNTEITSMQRV